MSDTRHSGHGTLRSRKELGRHRGGEERRSLLRWEADPGEPTSRLQGPTRPPAWVPGGGSFALSAHPAGVLRQALKIPTCLEMAEKTARVLLTRETPSLRKRSDRLRERG